MNKLSACVPEMLIAMGPLVVGSRLPFSAHAGFDAKVTRGTPKAAMNALYGLTPRIARGPFSSESPCAVMPVLCALSQACRNVMGMLASPRSAGGTQVRNKSRNVRCRVNGDQVRAVNPVCTADGEAHAPKNRAALHTIFLDQ
jgi:hypothetical protein